MVACGHVHLHHAERAVEGCEVCTNGVDCAEHAKVCKTPTIHALACDLDHLEKHVDWYGSVVAKVPDVWGQARLTQHREEYEAQMKPEQNPFEFALSGSLSRSDQAFFAQATTLAMAAQPKPPLIGRTSSTKTLVPTEQIITVKSETKDTTDDTKTTKPKTTDDSDVTDVSKLTGEKTGSTETTTTMGKPDSPKAVEIPKVKDVNELVSTPTFGSLTKTRGIQGGQVSIEPELRLAQKSRYLDFLNQLRRTNEGDDKSDAPGYSLNLMRIPVSVLPGKRTDEGHGAEITFTVDPVLGDDLLPVTFRRMVVNDLLHQLGFSLTQVLDDESIRALLVPETKQFVEGMAILSEWSKPGTADVNDNVIAAMSYQDKARLEVVVDQMFEKPSPAADFKLAVAVRQLQHQFRHSSTLTGFGCGIHPPSDSATPAEVAPLSTSAANHNNAVQTNIALEQSATKNSTLLYKLKPESSRMKYERVEQKFRVPSLSFSNGVGNKLGYPTSQIFDALGEGFAFEIAFGAFQGLEPSIKRQKYAHLPDVLAYLREEATAAHQFLAEPANQHLWSKYCTPQLVEAIRSRRLADLENLRDEFRCDIEKISRSGEFRRQRPENELIQHSKTAALAWCIIVDSALLTDKLVRDMKETASAKGKPCPNAGDAWLGYYLPNPPPEARIAFNEYVKMRWPVYVFALDPSTQDQNIADALSTRRETQLALAIAFTNGQIGVNTLTKYNRKLEADYETIALNRTQVGFSHGENVFGWRFYPRFQTPDTESNLKVLVRDQLIGGPSTNALLHQRRLEPGPRECVAIVVMPSFVPYVEIDSVSNWFGLANPKHKVLDHTQAVRLSKTVRTLQNCECKVTDADCYRDGELHRLEQRVKQLANRLPMQSQTVPVPILNTLGGFEMFSNGATDLAPELYGWYGAPGVSAKQETTLFLVGDHFSPLRSQVIVGNRPVATKMLSRQVMQVTVPKGVLGVEGGDRKGVFAQTHIATPYGVTRELLIPIVDREPTTPSPDPKPGYSIGGGKIVVTYQACTTKDGKLDPQVQAVKAEKLDFTWFDPTGAAPKDLFVRFEFEANGVEIHVPCHCSVEASLKDGERKVTLTDAAITTIGESILKQLARSHGQNARLLTGTLKSKKIFVTPVKPVKDHAVAEVEANGELVVEFKPIGCCLPTNGSPEKKKSEEKPPSPQRPPSPAPASMPAAS